MEIHADDKFAYEVQKKIEFYKIKTMTDTDFDDLMENCDCELEIHSRY